MIQKLSISLPETLCNFMAQYQASKGLHSRSEVVAKALALLQEQSLETSYREANVEWNAALDLLAGDE
ncbi:MAG: CopG family transcriptional regulator [Gammaproteobacteria bacterium]|nr:CopG family transcriptional regulator [Gammaproteobacteria bacterium]